MGVGALTLALALSGCSIYRQQQAQKEATERLAAVKDREEQANQECRRLIADPAIDPIRSRITALQPEGAPLSQLSDPSFASPADLPAIEAFEAARHRCSVLVVDIAVAYFSPEVVQVAVNAQAVGAKLSEQLYSRQITFGAFNTGRAEAAQQSRSNLVGAAQHAQERMAAAAAQAEAADRQQRAQTSMGLMVLGTQMIQASRPVSAVAAPRAPIITNCQNNGYGNTNCTTY